MSAIRCNAVMVCCCDADSDVLDGRTRRFDLSIIGTITGDCLSSARSDRLRGHCSITRRNDRTYFRSVIRCPMPHMHIDQAPGRAADAAPRDPSRTTSCAMIYALRQHNTSDTCLHTMIQQLP